MSKQYIIEERCPTVEEYRSICASVGWEGVINFEAAAGSLARSLYGVVALHNGEAVGMGRIRRSPVFLLLPKECGCMSGTGFGGSRV